uniref:Uncharacterized protein n=1 Tax=Anguilla anguilla TaxID=7936 RepID=A0A0E9PR11_ANGAN
MRGAWLQHQGPEDQGKEDTGHACSDVLSAQHRTRKCSIQRAAPKYGRLFTLHPH